MFGTGVRITLRSFAQCSRRSFGVAPKAGEGPRASIDIANHVTSGMNMHNAPMIGPHVARITTKRNHDEMSEKGTILLDLG